jgi:predicted permease
LFTEADSAERQPVVVVDDYMAAQLWPNENPIGKRIRNGGLHASDPWMTVIGVVGRVKQYTLDTGGRIAFYLPHTQFPTRQMSLVLRSAVAPASLTNLLKEQIAALDPDLPIYAVRTMEERVSDSLAQRRFSLVLLVVFAGFSMVLAIVGIYGVVAYLVSQGTREIGIRMALGATQQKIVNMVLLRAMALTMWGVGIGVVGALFLTRLLQGLLYGIAANDRVTFSTVAALLMLVALVASYIPARRAANIDPLVSLRTE